MKRLSYRMAAEGMGLALLAACSGAKTDKPVVTNAADTTVSASGVDAARRGKSMIRLVNAVPGAAAVDLTADDKSVFTAVAYKSVTPYAEIGDNMVKMKLQGAGGAPLAENSETMTDGYRYTVVALPKKDSGVELKVVRDEVVPDSGKVKLRVIHAAPGMGEIDVLVPGQRDPLFDNINYGTEAGYKELAPMTGVLEIRGEHGSQSVRLKSMKYEAGKAYTVVISGPAGRKAEVTVFDDTARM
ncbi:MAG: DUF4397 domain-containing protein [Gemmatimonadota bacterium]